MEAATVEQRGPMEPKEGKGGGISPLGKVAIALAN